MSFIQNRSSHCAAGKGFFKEAAIEKCYKVPGGLAMSEQILEPL